MMPMVWFRSYIRNWVRFDVTIYSIVFIGKANKTKIASYVSFSGVIQNIYIIGRVKVTPFHAKHDLIHTVPRVEAINRQCKIPNYSLYFIPIKIKLKVSNIFF